MKNKLLVLLLFFGLIIVNSVNIRAEDDLSNKKILITYYSKSGNTEFVAKEIQKKIGGELYKIETNFQYPNGYKETTEIAKRQIESGEKLTLKNKKEISEYDVIFVGTPVWWGKMAPAVMTFLSENDFKGKIVIPFITHGGGGGYSIEDDIEEITKVDVEDPFVVYGKSLNENDLNHWIEDLRD